MSTSFEISDPVRLYALEMAYASRCSNVEEIRSLIDQAPDLFDKVNKTAISSIQLYGKNLVNMRTRDPRQCYPTVQLPVNSWENTYHIYTLCMKIIAAARLEELTELELQIRDLREVVPYQLEALRVQEFLKKQEALREEDLCQELRELEIEDNDCFGYRNRGVCRIA